LKSTGSDQIAALRAGLEAASIILWIAVSPSVDRRATNEDAIEASITLMRLHLSKSLVPAWNQTGHLLAVKTATLDGAKASNTSPSKKRRLNSGGTANGSGGGGTSVSVAKDLKKVYKHILPTSNLQLLLMERLEQLIRAVSLDDQQILILTSGSLVALEIDSCGTATTASNSDNNSSKNTPPASQLQLASIALVTAAFAKYPMHRETILEDLFPLLLRLPTGKRSLRGFRVRYASAPSPRGLQHLNSTLLGGLLPNASSEQPHCVQMTTAMVLALVQSCVTRPMYMDTGGTSPGNNDQTMNGDATDEGGTMRLASGLGSCQAVCDSFVTQLLKRCARKGGAAEFRPFLTTFVEDLLLVLLIPEYPGAEMLLATFMRRWNQDLTLARAKNSSQTLEATYVTAVFDVLGKVCAVEARIMAAHRENAMKMTTDVPMSDDGAMNLKCFCGKHKTDVLLISCDHCHTFFHGMCVGLSSDTVPEEWACDSCRLARIADREQRKHRLDGNGSFLDDAYAMRHSYLSTLSHRMGVPEIEDATHFHTARWADELEQKALALTSQNGSQRKIVADVLEHWDGLGPSGEDLTEEGSKRAIISLIATTSTLFLSFKNQVGFILKLMSDDSTPSLRKFSLKAVEKIVEGDPQLMLLPVVTKAVSRRLSDDTISVREAALSLVGSYVVQSPRVANTFHSSLVACLTDVGVSVRKRAVRIYQDILMSNPRYKGRSAACDVMLRCAADPKEEDGVRDLIYDLFGKLWLQDGDVVVSGPEGKAQTPKNGPLSSETVTPLDSTQGLVVGGSAVTSVVTPTPPAPSSKREKSSGVVQKRADVAAEQMMEVVKAGDTGEHLKALLAKLLRGSSESGTGRKETERKKRKECSQKQCDQLTSSLFELLVSVEEQRSHRAFRVGKDIAATLRTIVVFAEVSPSSVFRHLDTVLPYLKADNGVSTDDEASIVGATCDIIFRLTSFLDRSDLERLAAGPIGGDLVQITYKFGSTTLASSIRALSTLAHHFDAGDGGLFGKKLLGLALTFYSYVCRKDSIDDFSAVDEKIRSNTHRALTVLGLICQEHPDSLDSSTWGDEVESQDEDILPASELTWSTLTLACYRIFSKFLQKRDYATKCAALRALGGIFVAQPRLMLKLEQIGLIADVMSDTTHASVQLESLQCWRNILLAEEKRVDDGHAKAKMDADQNITVSKRISGDQDGDATLFGGVLTNHAPRLFEMTQSQDRRIRFAALDLLGLLLRQGLVNPNEAVPFLMALQGDVDNSHIRSLALRLLMTEGEKRPDAVRQQVCAGVKQAYAFQRAIYSKKSVSALVTVQRGKSADLECVFDSVFKECIANSRKQRHGLFRNLLVLFELGGANQSNGKAQAFSVEFPLLSFASQILAHLPYSTAGDPLFIIHHIGSMVTLQGAQVLDRFAGLLRPLGLSSSDEYDEANASADALELAARSKFPSRTQEARPMSSKDFDMRGFLELCSEAAALILLLRLKTFLRKLYNLSETRCLEYDPTSKDKIGEKGISKADLSKPFDASIPMAMHTQKAVDKDALIRQYAEFRILMRAETSADVRMNSSDDEKAPAQLKRSADDA
jgi:cohesin loading factor subunit SCC2